MARRVPVLGSQAPWLPVPGTWNRPRGPGPAPREREPSRLASTGRTRSPRLPTRCGTWSPAPCAASWPSPSDDEALTARVSRGRDGRARRATDAGLGEHVAQVERDGARRDPALGGHVLVRQALADQLGDLELHRRQVQQGGRVALAGGLARRAELGWRGPPAARRAGRGRSPARPADGCGRPPDAGSDAGTRRTRAGRAPGRTAGPQRRSGPGTVSNERRVAPGRRVRARPKSTAASAHGRRGAAGERGELVAPRRRAWSGVAGADGGVDAVDWRPSAPAPGPASGERWCSAPAGSPVSGGAGALGPAGQVVRPGRSGCPGGYPATTSSRRPGVVEVVAARRAARRVSQASGAAVRVGWPTLRASASGLVGGAAQGCPPAGDEQLPNVSRSRA